MGLDVGSKLIKTGLPFVTVKYAQTLDGRIATATGDSKWISGEPARRYAHKLRSQHEAIMVGIGTVLADDPQLTVRLVRGRDPLRVVVDSRLRIASSARVLADGAAAHTLIATAEPADHSRLRELELLGAQVILLPPVAQGVDLAALLAELGRRGIESVLAEGGSRLITSLLAQRLVDRLVVIVAPKIVGRGLEAIGDLGISRLREAVHLSSTRIRRLGDDIVIDAIVSGS